MAQQPVGAKIVELVADSSGRWADFVRSRPDAVIYQHPQWAQVLARAYGFRILALGCEDASGKLLGVLPLCYTAGILRRRGLSSLPRTPSVGPLAASGEVGKMLMRAAIDRVRAETGTRLEIKVAETTYAGAVPDMVRVRWDATYVRELSGAAGELRFGTSRNHAQITRAVRKSRRLGVEVRAGEGEEDLWRWYQLYLETVRRHGVPPRPYRFFQVAWSILSPDGMMRLLIAEEGSPSRVIAGSVFFAYGKTMFFAFNGSRGDALALRPNDAIHWQAIHDAQAGGFRYYDLGEVDAGNDGLARFKTKWGAEPHWLYRYYYPALGAPAHPTVEAGGHARLLARMIWRRLPIRATAVIGELLYRYL